MTKRTRPQVPTRLTRRADGRQRRTQFLLARLLSTAVVVPLLAAARVGATECATTICAGATCTITGSHVLAPGCDLNFGSKDVTIAAAATFTQPTGVGYSIEAHSLTLQGTLDAQPGGEIDVTLSGDFTTPSGSAGKIIVGGSGTIAVTAAGNLALAGAQVISADGGGGTINLTGASATIGQALSANGGGADAGAITVTSTSGGITVSASVQAHGSLTAENGGDLDLESASDVTVSGAIVLSGASGGSGDNAPGGFLVNATGTVELDGSISNTGSGGGGGGDVSVFTTGNIRSTKPIQIGGSGGGDGGTLDLESINGDVRINGSVDASGYGDLASGGLVTVVAGPDHTITVDHTVDASTTDNGLFDGDIDLGPACTVAVSSTLKVHSAAGLGTIQLESRQTLNVAGAILTADSNGQVALMCRCIDTNNDGVCDGGCVQAPTGIAKASVTPLPVIEPVPLGPCVGCPNGLIDAPGEQCDDGNFNNFDGCTNDCKLTGCGDGIVEPGEQCDDGNTANGDCCSSTCQFEPAGNPCTSDDNPCTDDLCNAAGGCQHLDNTALCDDGDVCTSNDACSGGVCVGQPAPQAGCLTPPARHASIVIKKASSRAHDLAAWKWRGGTTSLTDFGDPSGATSYTLCIYDQGGPGPRLTMSALVAAGGLCAGKPCWQPVGTKGFKYANSARTPDGVSSLTLESAGGMGNISLAAKGANVPPPALPLTPTVTAQLKASNGQCWEANYGAPNVSRNDTAQFRAKSN
jgi:cysteine-rich repeat protein